MWYHFFFTIKRTQDTIWEVKRTYNGLNLGVGRMEWVVVSGSLGLDLGSLCLPAVGRRQKGCRDGNKGKSATAARWTFIYRTSRALRSAYNGLRRCMDVRCTLCDVHCGMHKRWRALFGLEVNSMCVYSRFGGKRNYCFVDWQEWQRQARD